MNKIIVIILLNSFIGTSSLFAQSVKLNSFLNDGVYTPRKNEIFLDSEMSYEFALNLSNTMYSPKYFGPSALEKYEVFPRFYIDMSNGTAVTYMSKGKVVINGNFYINNFEKKCDPSITGEGGAIGSAFSTYLYSHIYLVPSVSGGFHCAFSDSSTGLTSPSYPDFRYATTIFKGLAPTNGVRTVGKRLYYTYWSSNLMSGNMSGLSINDSVANNCNSMDVTFVLPVSRKGTFRFRTVVSMNQFSALSFYADEFCNEKIYELTPTIDPITSQISSLEGEMSSGIIKNKKLYFKGTPKTPFPSFGYYHFRMRDHDVK